MVLLQPGDTVVHTDAACHMCGIEIRQASAQPQRETFAQSAQYARRLAQLLAHCEPWSRLRCARELEGSCQEGVCVCFTVCVTSAESIGGCFKTYVCMKINNIPPYSVVPRTWLPQCPPGCRHNILQ